MKRFALPVIALLLLSCNNQPAPAVKTDTTRSLVTPVNAAATDKATALDSIDRANAETIKNDGEHINTATVEIDSSITVFAYMKMDHRLIGYEKPDIHSKRLILFSIFTNDVENNPFNCPYGSYYETSKAEDLSLKYTGDEGAFIKANIVRYDSLLSPVYFERKFVEFE